MGRINWRRVVLGGLLAGVIILAAQMVFHWAIAGWNWWFFRALAQPIEGASSIARYAGLHIMAGIAVIWLYAAARPRYGPGPKTAALIGVAYWVVGYALPAIGFQPLIAEQFRNTRMWVISELVYLVGVVVGSLAGAKAYMEEPNPPASEDGQAGGEGLVAAMKGQAREA